MSAHPEFDRLVEVMAVLRRDCPWDRAQTHRSLLPYLVEEACEVVDAVETGTVADLREELGDVLLQVVFHAELAGEGDDGFDIEEVARGITDKLVARHPHVFGDEVAADDLHGIWERRKAAEKNRSSALDGIPARLSALSRASKVLARARSHRVPLELASQPIEAEALGREILALVARAQSSGIDAEQAVRDAVRELETQVRTVEPGPAHDTRLSP